LDGVVAVAAAAAAAAVVVVVVVVAPPVAAAWKPPSRKDNTRHQRRPHRTKESPTAKSKNPSSSSLKTSRITEWSSDSCNWMEDLDPDLWPRESSRACAIWRLVSSPRRPPSSRVRVSGRMVSFANDLTNSVLSSLNRW